MLDSLIRNVRFGIRMLTRNPGFTAVAVTALALGIGANTAIFSVVDAVLLRSLPYPEADRLVFISERAPKLEGMSVAYPNFVDWRAQNRSFASMTARQSENFILTGVEAAERIEGSNVTADMFATVGVNPILGRAFTPDEDKPGAPRVVVISHSLWERRFNRSKDVLGRSITLNSEPYTIVGVMPPGFRFPINATRGDIWASLGRHAARNNNRGNHPGIYVTAKLKPEVSLEQARADMENIAANLRRQYPDTNSDNSVTLDMLHARMVRGVRPAMLIVLVAVAFVLLIACANVANLLLARSAARTQEMAVRTALGAGRWQIVRQLLVESLILALFGGALGLLIGYWGLEALVAILPEGTPRLAEVRIDGRILLFNAGISLLTGLLFGLAPAWQAARANLGESMKESGQRTTADRHKQHVRNGLIVSEVALSLMLLAGAGLMIQSFRTMSMTSAGVDTSGVLAGAVGLRGDRYKEPHQLTAFIDQSLANIARLPGVRSAAVITPLPLGVGGWQTAIHLEGVERTPKNAILTDIARVTPGYFQTMGVPLIRGRIFTPQDRMDAPRVAVIDETFAQKQFSGRDPLGQKIIMGDNRKPEVLEIVGIVHHVKNYGIDEESRIELYLPFAQSPVPILNYVVKSASAPASSHSSGLRAAVAAVDPDQPVFNITTMDELFAASIANQRVSTLLLGVFAGVALLLAAVGIYGIISYSVTQRTHEIGIRMALGAGRRDVLRLVIGQGLILTLGGLLIGIMGSLGLTQYLSTLLFGISPTDWKTFLGVSLLLSGVSLLATWIPARRATRVDPIIALRYQ